MIPESYRLENGCHNCKYAVADFSFYNCKLLCSFNNKIPKDPTKGMDYLTGNDVENFSVYYKKKTELCVDPFGKCDEWEMREEEFERRKKTA